MLHMLKNKHLLTWHISLLSTVDQCSALFDSDITVLYQLLKMSSVVLRSVGC